MAGVALDFKRWTVGLDGEFGCCKLASNSKTRNLAFFFIIIVIYILGLELK